MALRIWGRLTNALSWSGRPTISALSEETQLNHNLGSVCRLNLSLRSDGPVRRRKHLQKAHFHGAVMDSGSILPTTPIDGPTAQNICNTVVQNAGCSAASYTFSCLRSIDSPTFFNAANLVPNIDSYSGLGLSYVPRQDGKVLQDSTTILAKEGRFASVPSMITDEEDEGTIFSLFQNNITNTDQHITYLNDYVSRCLLGM
jgi:carboxylesterase type B